MAINWNTLYAPQTIDELALYPALKDELNLYYDDGDYGHLIFAGGWGTGKTTASNILGKKHPNDFVEYDCAGNTTKKELRKIIAGTLTVTMFGGNRIVLLDEFHNIKTNEQTIFNVPMEKNVETTTYILCVNDLDKVNPAIQSRCTILNFDVGKLHPKTNKLSMHRWVNMTKTEWIDELKRAANIVADKDGVIISTETYAKVISNDAYLTDVRSFIRAVNRQFKIDERNN
jgi:replication-associated recombination protein RarA